MTHYASDCGLDVDQCNFLEDGNWTTVLVATQAFADLNLVKPDFVVPTRFLFLANGSVRIGASELHYDAPPGADNAPKRHGGWVRFEVATNNAGNS